MAESAGGRLGFYVKQSTGYRAFIPNALPPDPPLRLEGDLLMLHSEADRAIGRLDAAPAWNRLGGPDRKPRRGGSGEHRGGLTGVRGRLRRPAEKEMAWLGQASRQVPQEKQSGTRRSWRRMALMAVEGHLWRNGRSSGTT